MRKGSGAQTFSSRSSRSRCLETELHNTYGRDPASRRLFPRWALAKRGV